MMWILQAILFLLKWIGILLLIILGILLLIIFVVLFVPIRYQVEGSYYEKPDVKVKVSWLLSAVAVFFALKDKETDLKIRLLGFSLGGKEKTKKNSKRKKAKKEAEEVLPDDTDGIEGGEKAVSEAETTEPLEVSEEEELEITEISGQEENSKTEKTSRKTKPSRKEKSPKKKETSKNSSGTGDWKEKLNFLKEQWEDPGNRALLKDILFRLKKIFLHLLPRRFRIKVHFGLEDNPATMGQILSILAILYPIYGSNIVIIPDFEQQIVEGEVLIKGRIRLIVFVYAVIRILLNPQVRILIRRIKRQNGADHE